VVTGAQAANIGEQHHGRQWTLGVAGRKDMRVESAIGGRDFDLTGHDSGSALSDETTILDELGIPPKISKHTAADRRPFQRQVATALHPGERGPGSGPTGAVLYRMPEP